MGKQSGSNAVIYLTPHEGCQIGYDKGASEVET